MARPLWKGPLPSVWSTSLWSCTWLSAITGLDSGCSMPRTVHRQLRARLRKGGRPVAWADLVKGYDEF